MDQGMMHGNSSEMGGMDMPDQHEMMMHMTFFWGRRTEVLFSGWPGGSAGMYGLCIILAFLAAVLVEWLSVCRLIKTQNRVAARIAQTSMHLIRVGLAYLLMLALMSFNGGVFLAVLAGHTVGFLVFGSRVFRPGVSPDEQGRPPTDLPPLKC